jgi:putative transposase
MCTHLFLIKVSNYHCKRRLLNIAKSYSNSSAIKVYKKRSYSKIAIGQSKYLNNVIEQDHRFINCMILNRLGSKTLNLQKEI